MVKIASFSLFFFGGGGGDNNRDIPYQMETVGRYVILAYKG